MSMFHKAYAFEWLRFEREFLADFVLALDSGDCQTFIAFISANLHRVADPYEGEPLPADWQISLRESDVQVLADYALTAYYNPAADRGIGGSWLAISDKLPRQVYLATLGAPAGNFDPGACGSYFQSPAAVESSLNVLSAMPTVESDLLGYIALLTECRNQGLGMYVTF